MIPKLTEEPGAIALAAQIRAGKLSPSEAVEAAIGRIETLDGPLNAVVVRDFDRARAAAKALDGEEPGERPLFGVPMTVKESFDVAGLPSCWGHEQFSCQVAARDSEVVQRLKAAGAVVLGKTNVPVDLADWQAFNPVYGRTVNPHDHSRSPGGSSGGSAAAVASGMVPIEYGSDIGGSVRVPAHFCGVWGHKTSWGLVSKRGHGHPMMGGADAHETALAITGPLARDADDLALLVELTAGVRLRPRGKALKDWRVLLLVDHPACPVSRQVREPIEAAVRALETAGIAVDRTSDRLPDLEQQQRDYLKMLNIAMARGAPGPDGAQASASDWFDLLDAQTRNEFAWSELFEGYDFVLAPPAPILAPPHRDEALFRTTIDIDGRDHPAGDALAFPGLATFPNLPATVLPVGQSDGLPCGMQVIGPQWGDLDCIAAAKAIGEIVGA